MEEDLILEILMCSIRSIRKLFLPMEIMKLMLGMHM